MIVLKGKRYATIIAKGENLVFSELLLFQQKLLGKLLTRSCKTMDSTASLNFGR
jgi:hypothetical protein